MMEGGDSGGDLWRGREWCAGPLILFVGHPFSFMRGRFAHARSSSFVCGVLRLLSGRRGRFRLVVRLVACWGSVCPRALVARGWGLVVVWGWRVAYGGSSLFGVGYRRPWVGHSGWGIIVRAWALLSAGGALLSVGGAFGVGYRRLYGGIVVRGWGITFRGWHSSLSVGGGTRHLLWFERPCLSVMVDVRVSGGYLHGWWARCGGLRGVGVHVDGGGVRVGVGVHVGGGDSSGWWALVVR